jgi:hypothetical protein
MRRVIAILKFKDGRKLTYTGSISHAFIKMDTDSHNISGEGPHEIIDSWRELNNSKFSRSGGFTDVIGWLRNQADGFGATIEVTDDGGHLDTFPDDGRLH